MATQNEQSKGPRHLRARRPPPDYTQRGVKLKLFIYVAVIMAVLAAIERLRDKPTWQWLAKLDQGAPRETFANRLTDAARTANDSAGTFIAAAQPKSTVADAAPLNPVQ